MSRARPFLAALALTLTAASAVASQEAAMVAARLREAYAAGQDQGIAALTDLFAPSVHVTHVPAHPSDGPFSRAALAEGYRAETAAARRAMPDYRFRILSISNGDGTVEVVRVSEGTRGDGRQVRSLVRSVYTLENGKIIRFVVHLEGDRPPEARP